MCVLLGSWEVFFCKGVLPDYHSSPRSTSLVSIFCLVLVSFRVCNPWARVTVTIRSYWGLENTLGNPRIMGERQRALQTAWARTQGIKVFNFPQSMLLIFLSCFQLGSCVYLSLEMPHKKLSCVQFSLYCNWNLTSSFLLTMCSYRQKAFLNTFCNTIQKH